MTLNTNNKKFVLGGIILKKILNLFIFISSGVFILLGAGAMEAHAENLLDSDGQPVITGRAYSIELKTNTGKVAYFSTGTYSDFDTWLAPSISKPSDRSFYIDRGDEPTGNVAETNKNYQMRVSGGPESGFLTKQNTNLFYPHGGAYIQGDREDAMAISFSKAEDGYNHHNMGLIYRSGMSDIVVSGSGGEPFVVKFIKK